MLSVVFSAMTLLGGNQEEHAACKTRSSDTAEGPRDALATIKHPIFSARCIYMYILHLALMP